ncbi:response regulator transcription factor [Bacillus sp. H-16]|uniref:LytR/AlgR family response regulator transcription factor n=1 Tax=Alteribacter salitolerans TaxID=2912333 RepID=UPI00196688E0|nr:LytTR family DNA-binding domain-containing protein [Alteribacter salitolerans]MBM7095289.1 response regulator transcription factor [Alteribacter salitolerans]
MIRVVIVDDEPLSRDELAHLLSEYKDMEVVGQAGSGEEGLELSLKLSPDVLFLDIEMAEMSGVELAKSLQQLKKVPAVVFATAYPDYAVNAFRLEALDYLLKPFDEEQLEETVERIRSLHKTAPETPSKKVSRLAVEHDETIIYLTPEEIDYCFREGKETKVCTRERCYSSRLTLRELEEKLGAHSFFRTHKGYLVNLEQVESLTPWLNGAYQVKMRGGTDDIPVSRNYVKELRQKLEL